MTGPEHYKEAERIVAVVQDELTTSPQTPAEDVAVAVRVAQAHATLALAAATAQAGGLSSPAWAEAVNS